MKCHLYEMVIVPIEAVPVVAPGEWMRVCGRLITGKNRRDGATFSFELLVGSSGTFCVTACLQCRKILAGNCLT